MKAIVAVVQGQDTVRLSNALRKEGIPFTTVNSTGGFLRERNSTFLMGIQEENVQGVLDVLSANCQTRGEYVSSYPSAFDPTEFYMPRPIEVQVGGASVWVVDVEYFEPL
ncbi:MAG TPA: cyclic-di-AMP receptor [Chloroflexia bacterium]|nr:cyclic-di-AMP receptor [Chloroflexia bacterium]